MNNISEKDYKLILMLGIKEATDQGSDNGSEDSMNLPFGSKVLRRKLDMFRPELKIPMTTILMFDLLTESKPAHIQLILLDTIAKMNKGERHEINIMSSCEIFGDKFPSMSRYDAIYDHQKLKEGNLIDCKEYWDYIFDSESNSDIIKLTTDLGSTIINNRR